MAYALHRRPCPHFRPATKLPVLAAPYIVRHAALRATPEPAETSGPSSTYSSSGTPPLTTWSALSSQQKALFNSDAPKPRRTPDVDWSRYHLQVLFIDSTDTTRARIAAGLFEKIAEWNGFGRALYPWTCGVDAKHKEYADWSTTASLMSQAALLGIMPKYFARAADRMELEDLDRYDIVVALDNSIRDIILSRVDQQYWQYYDERVCLLTDFAPYTGEAVHQTGGLSLLPQRMAAIVRASAQQLEQAVDVDKPVLTDAEAGLQQWNQMVKVLLLACAGLVKFLIDAYPNDLPDYDPQ